MIDEVNAFKRLLAFLKWCCIQPEVVKKMIRKKG